MNKRAEVKDCVKSPTRDSLEVTERRVKAVDHVEEELRVKEEGRTSDLEMVSDDDEKESWRLNFLFHPCLVRLTRPYE